MLLHLMGSILELPCGMALGKVSVQDITFSALMLSALLLTISILQIKYAHLVATHALVVSIIIAIYVSWENFSMDDAV